MKSIWEASLIVFFAAASQQTRFSLFLTPLLLRQSIEAFYKRPQENVQLVGVVHLKTTSNKQMKKLFDNGELGPAENTNPYRGRRPSFTSVSSLADEDKRINAR